VSGNFDLASFVTPWVFAYLAVFCRVGAAFMSFPGIGEVQVPPHVRLFLALAVSLPLSMAAPGIPQEPPASVGLWAGMVVSNLVAGAYFGIAGRALLASLHFAGQAISQTIGLMNPFGAAAPGFEGASAVTALLVYAGAVAVLAADLHHGLIEALLGSFSVIPIMGTPDIPMQALAIAKLLGQSTRLALQFAAPFLVIGLVFNMGLGIANRMMPNLAVYFVFSPALMAAGFAVLGLISTGVIIAFVDELGELLMSI